jgi:hypothetical protein
MQPTYPIFSKRAQREQKTKRGAYNFARSTEFHEAEKWFEARKGRRAEYNPPPRPEPCDLDLMIPSYEDFHYNEIQYHFPTILFYDMSTLQRIASIWPKQ